MLKSSTWNEYSASYCTSHVYETRSSNGTGSSVLSPHRSHNRDVSVTVDYRFPHRVIYFTRTHHRLYSKRSQKCDTVANPLTNLCPCAIMSLSTCTKQLFYRVRALFTSERRDLVPHSQVKHLSALYFVHRLQANMKPSTNVVDDISYLSTDRGVRDKQVRRNDFLC